MNTTFILLLSTIAIVLAQNNNQPDPFSLVIFPDNAPQETNWQLSTINGEVIASGPGTEGASGTLNPGDFVFTIFDTAGNGLCCGNGFGFYALRTNDINFYTSNGRFSRSERVVFRLDANGQPTLLDGGAPPRPPQRGGQFNIDLVPAPGFDPSTRPQSVNQLFAAARRWESIITGDLPSILGIDDLEITYEFIEIDGLGGIAGNAGPDFFRVGSNLPFNGSMRFDIADFDDINEEARESLLLHEIGHVLGIGSFWRDLGCSNCEIDGDQNYNPNGRCPTAEIAFNRTPGRRNGVPLLVETEGGPGTACRHFDEEQLQSELMTPTLSLNPQTGISELSTITIGALQDIGYNVNFEAADPFTVPAGPLNGGRPGRGRGRGRGPGQGRGRGPPRSSQIIMNLEGDVIVQDSHPMMKTDIERDMVMQDLTAIMAARNTSSTSGIVAGSLGAAAVVGVGVAAFFIRRRRKQVAALDVKTHVMLSDSA